MADIVKRRITELSRSAVVLPNDEVIILQNGRSLRASVSQLALAQVDVNVDAIEGLNDRLNDKVNYDELDEKADKVHNHTLDDLTDVSAFGKDVVKTADNKALTAILNVFDENSAGVVPNFGTTNSEVILTSNGWKNRNIKYVPAGGLKVTPNDASGISIELDVNDLEQTPEITNDIDFVFPLYHINSQKHYKSDLSVFARKAHKHDISDVNLLDDNLDKKVDKEQNLSDIADKDQALTNLGLTTIGKGVSTAVNTDDALNAVGLHSGENNINVFSIANSPIGVSRNIIPNGGFRYWPRGNEIVGLGHNAAGWRTKVYNGNGAGAITSSKVNFTLGDEGVDGTPLSYLRLAGSNFTSNDLSLECFIEDVSTMSGKNVNLSFWIKASVLREIRCYVTQNFGTGGTPSTEVKTLVSGNESVNTEWKKISIPFTMPSIQGKIIGDNLNSSYIKIAICVREGNFGINLGTGNIDITQVQLEPGQNATIFESRTVWEEEQRYGRYFQKIPVHIKNVATQSNQEVIISGNYVANMRTSPTVTITENTKTNITSAIILPTSTISYDVVYNIPATGVYESNIVATFSSEFLND